MIGISTSHARTAPLGIHRKPGPKPKIVDATPISGNIDGALRKSVTDYCEAHKLSVSELLRRSLTSYLRHHPDGPVPITD